MNKSAAAFDGSDFGGKPSITPSIKPTTPTGSQPASPPSYTKPAPVQKQPAPLLGNFYDDVIDRGKQLLQHGLPNNIPKAWNDYGTLNNPDIPYTNPAKIQAADSLKNWIGNNESHPWVADIAKSQAGQQLQQGTDSIGAHIARFGAPMLHNMTKTPEGFAKFVNMPGISDLMQPFLGATGLPGLAAAHGFLSGDMKNWNTLTAGIHDKSQRMPGRDLMGELKGLLNKSSSLNEPDRIDKHLADS